MKALIKIEKYKAPSKKKAASGTEAKTEKSTAKKTKAKK